jgi:hypothetical protein
VLRATGVVGWWWLLRGGPRRRSGRG